MKYVNKSFLRLTTILLSLIITFFFLSSSSFLISFLLNFSSKTSTNVLISYCLTKIEFIQQVGIFKAFSKIEPNVYGYSLVLLTILA